MSANECGPIPRILHQIWVGPHPIPNRSIEFITGLRALHPTFEYRLWRDADVSTEEFENYEFIIKTPSYAQKADLMRYEILHKYGGIYLDIDFELFKPLDPLLTNDLILCNEDERIHEYMTNAFLASSKGNVELKKCVKAVKDIDFSKSINVASGPYFLRKCIELTPSVSVLPTSYMYPVHFSNPQRPFEKTETTYGCHHWDKNW